MQTKMVKPGFAPADNSGMPRSTHRRLLAAAALTALAVPLAAVPPAGAGTFERAKVVRVIDGDTIDVDRNHDGRIDARIRLLGIDAPEHGLCGFAAATKALQSLVRHKTVELRSDRGRIGRLPAEYMAMSLSSA